MNKTIFTLILALVAGLTSSGAAHATLLGRDLDGNAATFEAYYDNVLDITWLADANYASTSGYDADGRMDWAHAIAWADGLSYGGYNDWRLPTVGAVGAWDFSNNGSTDVGTGNISANYELAYMYYVNFANLGFCTPNGGGSATSCIGQTGFGLVDDPLNSNDESLFSNLQSSVYWSGTSFPPNPSSAWFFDLNLGYQFANNKGSGYYYAWAVRPGDVAAVPEPGSIALLSLGLAGLGWARRRGVKKSMEPDTIYIKKPLLNRVRVI